ncbi:hypothetical protein IQ268_09080 [Oculatella sp. LEGE 06141]|uniref:hypothetical protein n=1 Tax=Oculatella sp. LEGE 06141 TaxID=1828648 RepID=UPI00187F5D97|nr:hypothetical protein [Oculatella sp. LEGE 06141]MBE9178712.1 hypothetical protein [Oculatella sp. LEGE 06141]
MTKNYKTLFVSQDGDADLHTEATGHQRIDGVNGYNAVPINNVYQNGKSAKQSK